MVLNICRLCLTKTNEPLNNILISTSKCSDLTLIDCLYWVFGVEVTVDDPFPKLICSECICVVNYIGSFRETFQRNQTKLQEKRDLFENHYTSEDGMLLLFKDVGTAIEKNIATSIEERNTNCAMFSRDQLEAISQPVLIIPRLEEDSDVYRKYKKIDDTLYKKIMNIDEVDRKKTSSPVSRKSKGTETSTNSVNNHIVMVSKHFSSPPMIPPRLEDTKLGEEFNEVNDTIYSNKQLHFIDYYYNVRTTALQELIKERSEIINNHKIIKRPKIVNDKREPLFKIDSVNDVYVCSYCSEAFETKQMINYHYKVKHRQAPKHETNTFRGKTRQKKKKRKFSRMKQKTTKSSTMKQTKRLVSDQTSNSALQISLRNKRLTPRMLLNGKEYERFNKRKLRKRDKNKRVHFPSSNCDEETGESDVAFDKLDEKIENSTQDKMLLSQRDMQQEVTNVPRVAEIKIVLERIELKKKVGINCDQDKHERFPPEHSVKEYRGIDVECSGNSDQNIESITQNKILLPTRDEQQKVKNETEDYWELKRKMSLLKNINYDQDKQNHYPTLCCFKENDLVYGKPDANLETTQDIISLPTRNEEQDTQNIPRPAEVEIIVDSIQLKEKVIHKGQIEHYRKPKRKIKLLNNINCDQDKQESAEEGCENDTECGTPNQNIENGTQDKISLATRDKEQMVRNIPQPAEVEMVLGGIEVLKTVMHKRQTEDCGELERKINFFRNVNRDQDKHELVPTLHHVKESVENYRECDKLDQNIESDSQDKTLLSIIDKEQEVKSVSQPIEVEIILDRVELMQKVTPKSPEDHHGELKRKIYLLKNINNDQDKLVPILHSVEESRKNDVECAKPDENIENTSQNKISLIRDKEQEIKNIPQAAEVETIDSVELKEKVILKGQTEHHEELKRKINLLKNINCNQDKRELVLTLLSDEESRENDIECVQPDQYIGNSAQDEILLPTKDEERQADNVLQLSDVEINVVELKEKSKHKSRMEDFGELKRKLNLFRNIKCNKDKCEHVPTLHYIKESKENDVKCDKPDQNIKNTMEDKTLLIRDNEQEVRSIMEPAEVETVLDSIELNEKAMYTSQDEHHGELKRKINLLLKNVNYNQGKPELVPTLRSVRESRENYVICDKLDQNIESSSQDKTLLTGNKEQEAKNIRQPAEVKTILGSVELKEKVILKRQTECQGELKRKIYLLKNINCDQDKCEFIPTLHAVEGSRENDIECGQPDQYIIGNTAQDEMLLPTKDKEQAHDVLQPVEVETILDGVELNEKPMHKHQNEHHEELNVKINLLLKNINYNQGKPELVPTLHSVKESRENYVECDKLDQNIETTSRDKTLLIADKEQESKNIPQPAEVKTIFGSVELKENVILKRQTEHQGDLKRKISLLKNINCDQDKRERVSALHSVEEGRKNDVECDQPDQYIENTTQDKILLPTKDEEQVHNVLQLAEVEINGVELEETVRLKGQVGHCSELKRKIDLLKNVNCNHVPTLHSVKESRENNVECDKPDQNIESITEDNTLLSIRDHEQKLKNVYQPAEVEKVLDTVEPKEKIVPKRQPEHREELKRKINLLKNINCNQDNLELVPTLLSVQESRKNEVEGEIPDQNIEDTTHDKILLPTKDEEHEVKIIPQPADMDIILDGVKLREKGMPKGQIEHYGQLQRKMNLLRNINCNQDKREPVPTLHYVNQSRENYIDCGKPIENIINITQNKIVLPTKDKEQEVKNLNQPAEVEMERFMKVKRKINLLKTSHCDQNKCEHLSALHSFKESGENDVECGKQNIESTAQDKILLSTRDKEQGINNIPLTSKVESILGSVELKEKGPIAHYSELRRKIDILEKCVLRKKTLNASQCEEKESKRYGDLTNLCNDHYNSSNLVKNEVSGGNNQKINSNLENSPFLQRITEQFDTVLRLNGDLSNLNSTQIKNENTDIFEREQQEQNEQHLEIKLKRKRLVTEICQRNQIELQENRDLFENRLESSASLLFDNIGTSLENNIGTAVKRRKMNCSTLACDQLQMVSQPIVIAPRLEESDIYREYKKIDDTTYKKIVNTSKTIASLLSNDVGATLENNIGIPVKNNCFTLTSDHLEMVSQPIIIVSRLEESDIYREYMKIGDTTYKKMENISKENDKKKFTNFRTLTNPVDKVSSSIGTSTNPVNGKIGLSPLDNIYRHFLLPSFIIPRLEDTKFLEEFDKISDTTYKQIHQKVKHNPNLRKYGFKHFNFIDDHNYSLPVTKERSDIIKNLKTFKHQKIVSGKSNPAFEVDNVNLFHCKSCDKTFKTRLMVMNHFRVKHIQLTKLKANTIRDKKCRKKKGYKKSRRKLRIMKSLTTGETKQLITDLITKLKTLKLSSRNKCLIPDSVPSNKFSSMIRRNWNNNWKMLKANQDKRDNFSIKYEHFPNLMFLKENEGNNLVYHKLVQEKQNTVQDKNLSAGDIRHDLKNVPEPNGVKLTLDSIGLKDTVINEKHTEHHREVERKINVLENVVVVSNVPILSQPSEEGKNESFCQSGNPTSDDPCIYNQEHSEESDGKVKNRIDNVD